MTSKNCRKNKGFTIIELLISISLIGILAGLVVGMINYPGIRRKMRDNTRKSDLRILQTALEKYFVDYRRYPVQLSWGNMPALGAAYLAQNPVDPSTSAAYRYMSAPFGAYYALNALMEISNSNDGHECTNLNSYTTLGKGFPNATDNNGDLCYGVESPTVLVH